MADVINCTYPGRSTASWLHAVVDEGTPSGSLSTPGGLCKAFLLSMVDNTPLSTRFPAKFYMSQNDVCKVNLIVRELAKPCLVCRFSSELQHQNSSLPDLENSSKCDFSRQWEMPLNKPQGNFTDQVTFKHTSSMSSMIQVCPSPLLISLLRLGSQ